MWFVLLAVSALAVVAVTGAVADVTGPNGVTASPGRDPDHGGFYTSPVTLTFSGLDAADPCEPAQAQYSGTAVSSMCTSAADPAQTYSDTFDTDDFPYDAEAPIVNVPDDITREATSAAGAVVTFDADVTADGGPDPTCVPDSGWTFDLGETTVICESEDAAGNKGQGSFKVVIRDTTGPQFGATPDVTRDANVPGGYRGEAYTVPSATDVVDGGVTPQCAPGPGSKFDLGTTEVECTATDARENATTAKFDVTVEDNTPPEFLVAPQDITVQARNVETGTPATNACIQSFLTSPTARDVVDDQQTEVEHDSTLDRFPVGDTVVTFTTEDAAGNVKTASAVVTVARGPQGDCTIDARPPGNVKRATAGERSRLVVLRWRNPGAADFWRVEIERRRTDGRGGTKTFRTRREVLKDRDVRNGVEYSYVLRSVDEAGNKPRGVARLATPHRILLLRPRDEARVLKRRPPLLKWVDKRRARYYNVQLYRLVNGNARKVLSRWPSAAEYKLKRTWRFEGRRQKLKRGRYVWYVWPSFGPRGTPRYGDVMGPSNFRVVRRR